MEREYVTAVSIVRGIILLIEPDGTLGCYRQRGIDTLSENEIVNEIRKGNLAMMYRSVRELPKHYSIGFEDTEIMGRAKATYQLVLDKNRAKRRR